MDSLHETPFLFSTGWSIHVLSQKSLEADIINNINHRFIFMVTVNLGIWCIAIEAFVYTNKRIRLALDSSVTWRNALSDVVPV